MKTKFKTTEKIPAYALPYIINGDASGLTDEEIKTIDNFCAQFPGAVYSPVTDADGNMDEYFTTVPAFGLPVTVIDVEIIIYE